MRGLALAVIAAAIMLGGCTRAGKGGTLPRVLDDFEHDPRPFIARVAKLRGLPQRRPPRVQFHDERSFRVALERELAFERGTTSASDTAAFFHAFGFSLPSSGAQTTAADVQREQVIAFYDDRAHAVHVRRPSTLSDEDRRTAALVLAHEIGHALQHDNFDVPPVRELTDDDTFLASMALLEGDAMLTMLAYASAEERVPLKRTLVRAQRSVERGDLDEYLKATSDSRRLMAAAPIVRERLMFPYLGGMRFMGMLHRTGGFALVDKSYRQPPVTTEQVLHPEKYLAGERAIEVPAPKPPPGFETLASGRMGELQIRITLERCSSRADAVEAAAGWGGDAYSIVRDRGGRNALLWATAWDSDDDAAEFERAIARTLRCWKQGGGVEGAVFGPHSRVLRRGSRVAVVRGLDLPGVLVGLLALPGDAPAPEPPFGPLTIPAVRPLVPTRSPFVEHGRYVNEKLGITAPVLPGYGVEIDREGALTLSRQFPSPATGFVGLSEWVVNQDTVDETFRRFAEGVQRAVDEVASAEIELISDPGRVRTPLGVAVERVWAVKRGQARIRLLMLPICGGNGSLLFAQLWADSATKAELDWWLGALRPVSSGAPPVCAELDP
jgi:hypothetical protein